MTPFAEPRADLEAQIRALRDPNHPKQAVFVVPKNARDIPALAPSITVTAHPEGTLLTKSAIAKAAFERHPHSDLLMALLLGLPEPKGTAVAKSGGWRFLYRARIVQARDERGNVITEALASPKMLDATRRALADHVPKWGRLVEMNPVAAIARRSFRRLTQGKGA